MIEGHRWRMIIVRWLLVCECWLCGLRTMFCHHHRSPTMCMHRWLFDERRLRWIDESRSSVHGSVERWHRINEHRLLGNLNKSGLSRILREESWMCWCGYLREFVCRRVEICT